MRLLSLGNLGNEMWYFDTMSNSYYWNKQMKKLIKARKK